MCSHKGGTLKKSHSNRYSFTWIGEYIPFKYTILLLGAFEKLRKVTISLAISVCPSSGKNSTPTGRIFIKFDIRGFFFFFVEKIQVSLKTDKNNEYFTSRTTQIFYHNSLNSS
jgi:hypothetical protein